MWRGHAPPPNTENQTPGQPAGRNSLAALDAHVQTPAASRLRVIVLPATAAGAFERVQTMVPVPAAAVPVTAIAQLLVGVVMFMLAAVGLVP